MAHVWNMKLHIINLFFILHYITLGKTALLSAKIVLIYIIFIERHYNWSMVLLLVIKSN